MSAFLCWKKPDAATPAAAVTCTKRTATKEQKSKIESTWGQESRAEQEQRARTHIACLSEPQQKPTFIVLALAVVPW